VTRPYSICIYGYPAPLEEIRWSLEMITFGLERGFRALPHVNVRGCLNVNHAGTGEIPPCDFLIIHACLGDFHLDFQALRATVGKTVLVLEYPSPLVDHNFCFREDSRTGIKGRTTILRPCLKDFLVNEPKDDKLVLLDHNWPPRGGQDFSAWLYPALEPLLDEGYRFIQLGGEARELLAPPWVTRIPVLPYPEYLAATARVGTFIPTHSGSYNHSLIDMFARGTRVLVRGSMHLPPDMVRDIRLPVFRSGDELRDLIRQPIDHAGWDRKIDLCTDMKDVVGVMDAWMTA